MGRKDKKSMYRYPKDARIIPVVTIVLSNAETWDGPRDLKDMLDVENVPEGLIPFISGYRINIVELPKLTKEITGRFRTDVRQVMDVFRCLRDPKAMKELVSCGDDYQELDEETYEYIQEYTSLKKYGATQDATTQEGGERDMNMKDAFDMIIEEEVEKANERNAENNRKNLREMIANFLKMGTSAEVISKSTKVPLDEVLEIEAGLLQKA